MTISKANGNQYADMAPGVVVRRRIAIPVFVTWDRRLIFGSGIAATLPEMIWQKSVAKNEMRFAYSKT